MSLLSDSQSQRVSASDQKLRFMSRWLQERAVSKSSSSVTKLPLGAWLALAAVISVSLSSMHLGSHVENEAVGSGGVGLGTRLPPLWPRAGCLWEPDVLLLVPEAPTSLQSVQINIHLSRKASKKKNRSLAEVWGFVCLFVFMFLFYFCFVLHNFLDRTLNFFNHK